jgi:hypothetical protein
MSWLYFFQLRISEMEVAVFSENILRTGKEIKLGSMPEVATW